MIVKDRYAEAEFKDVVRYKIKWLFMFLYRLYMNYVELYDFEFQSPYEVIFTFILYSKKNCIIINF